MSTPIHLSFVCGADFSSRAIAWYGNGYRGFSHVDSLLSDGWLAGARDDRVQVFEKNRVVEYPAGFQLRPADYESWVRRDIVELRVPDGVAEQWDKWLRSQVGKPYDKGAIIGFLLGRDDHQKGHWICSAGACGALVNSYAMPKPPVPFSQITPNSLHLMVYALGGHSILHYG